MVDTSQCNLTPQKSYVENSFPSFEVCEIDSVPETAKPAAETKVLPGIQHATTSLQLEGIGATVPPMEAEHPSEWGLCKQQVFYPLEVTCVALM